MVSPCTSFPFLCNGGSALFPFVNHPFILEDNVEKKKKKKSKQPPPPRPKKRIKLLNSLLCAVVGKKPQKILHYNSNIKWKSLLLRAPLMPPNQHVMGRCNQIISLRFGFPNSFPKLPSADRSLAFRMKGERWRQANDFRRTLNKRENGERQMVRRTTHLPHLETQ